MQPNQWLPLVFSWASQDQSGDLTPSISQLSSQDWDDMLHFTAKHGISPTLYDRITRARVQAAFPPAFIASLRQDYLNNAARNLYAQNQTTELLTGLESHRIPVILLKGIHFLSAVYSNPACRAMSDLDFLIHREHAAQVQEIASTLGYTMRQNPWEGPAHHLPPLSRPGSPFPLELHWELTSPNRASSLPLDLVWGSAQPAQYLGHACLRLPPALTLLHACQHAAYQHLFSNAPRALLDIDALLRIQSSQLDWDQFWQLAESIQSTNGIALLLILSHAWLAAPLPASVRGTISRVRIPGEIMDAVIECILLGEELPDSPPPGLLDKLRWWSAKTGKFISNAARPGAQSQTGHLPAHHRGINKINRLVYLVKDNIKATVDQSAVDRSQAKIKTNRLLRGWLKMT